MKMFKILSQVVTVSYGVSHTGSGEIYHPGKFKPDFHSSHFLTQIFLIRDLPCLLSITAEGRRTLTGKMRLGL